MRTFSSSFSFANSDDGEDQYALMAGNALLAQGDREGARQVFARGVAAAEAAGDGHALGELQAARAALD